jgi:hypothetical protein
MTNAELPETLQFIIHYGFHFIIPVIISYFFFRKDWKKTSLIMLSTIFVDADHLMANPLFDPERCSIGYHPLHSYPAIIIYFLMLIPRKCRIPAIGLLLHMYTDLQDCMIGEYIRGL